MRFLDVNSGYARPCLRGRDTIARALVAIVLAAAGALAAPAGPARVPVLGQIDLPHNYYFRELYLPQLTSGPSSVTWTPDGAALIYSMQGFLWRQALDGRVAQQLTDADGTDYQPDCSPDGRTVVFVRYDGRAMELMLLDLTTGAVRPLTAGGAVNVEPRWSPDGQRLAYVSTAGTGHFLLHVADVRERRIISTRALLPDRRSAVARYYYSPFDHTINPAWTRDGTELLFLSNREVAHGTGDLVRMAVGGATAPQLVQHEETSWHARPDVSPDGTRFVYSSYLGRQWQQLWLLPVSGGYPFPLTYGDYDNTAPRWSPDGRRIAFVSNRSGNTGLWSIDVLSGEEQLLQIDDRRYLRPRTQLRLQVRDEAGRLIPSRISITDTHQRTYAPDDALIHADDAIVRQRQPVETRYFHGTGESVISVPFDRLAITVSRGPSSEISRLDVDPRAPGWTETQVVTSRRLTWPDGSGPWWSGDLHVHMNYGGAYRNTPERLAAQAAAEDLDLVYNLVVNKEQRIPDVASFRSDADPASTERVLILHGQEFHTSYWGHLALLNLAKHLLLPDFAGYPFTAAASPYPHNALVAELARGQRAVVGYVHPFDQDVDPGKPDRLTNELPVDAALGMVDYYEAVGFSDHKASNAVWYRLLDCGLKLPAGAGTDAMANYASLRGPVGLNRVYVPAVGRLSRESFLAQLTSGRGMATNGALVHLTAGDAKPGDTLQLQPGPHSLAYRATLRANFPVDHLELIWNGAVVAAIETSAGGRAADVSGSISVTESGWLLLRAWNDGPDPAVPDVYPFSTTSPVYVEMGGRPRRSRPAANYFLQWLDRLRAATEQEPRYRSEGERNAVLKDVERARAFYTQCGEEADRAQ
jgi:TolB protein